MATVTTNSFIDNSLVYYPAVLQGNDQVVTSREVLYGGQVYASSVESTINVTTSGMIDGSQLYAPNVHATIDVTPSGFIDGWYLYKPHITWPIEVTTPSFIDGFQVYSPIVEPIIPLMFDSSAVYAPTVSTAINVNITGYIDPWNVLSPELEIGVTPLSPTLIDGFSFYSPTVQPGGRDISPSVIESREYFFPPRILRSVLSPATFKLSALPGGGDVTASNVAPRTRYYDIPDSKTITQDDLVYVESKNLFPTYIRARDAMFSTTFYRGFYVKNDSTSGTIRGLQFWINGGDDIVVENSSTPQTTFRENTRYLDEIDAKYNLTPEQYEAFNLSGKSNSSMLGQVKLETFVSPTKRLVEFDEDGQSIGLDLSRQRFIPANNPVRLPSLARGEYIGIYLRLTTKFSPVLNIPEDYSFMHLKYTSDNGSLRETYPGQTKNTTSFLPSVVLKFTTNYDKILDVIDDNKEKLYNRYPPFFLHYEDAE